MPKQIVNGTPITWEQGKPEFLAIPFRAEGMIHVQVPITIPSEDILSTSRSIALFDVRAGGEGRPLFRVALNAKKRTLRVTTADGRPGVGASRRLEGKGPRLVEILYQGGQVGLWLDGAMAAEAATAWLPEPGQPLSLVLGRKDGEPAAPIGLTFHGLGLGIGQEIGAEPGAVEQEPPPAPVPPAADATAPTLAQGLVHLFGLTLPAVVGYYGEAGAALNSNESAIAEQAARLAEAAYATLLERQRSGAWSPEKWRGL